MKPVHNQIGRHYWLVQQWALCTSFALLDKPVAPIQRILTPEKSRGNESPSPERLST